MMSAAPALSALLFLPFAIPISIWVAYSDMSRMKIPNKAVMALTAVYAVVGIVAVLLDAFSWSEYLWRYSHLVVILLIGFVANAAGLMGAGDAKFGAAMAPFVALADWPLFAYLFAASIIVGFVGHRIAKRIPFIRNRTEGWESWVRRDFPMGLCLSIALVVYLAVVATTGTA